MTIMGMTIRACPSYRAHMAVKIVVALAIGASVHSLASEMPPQGNSEHWALPELKKLSLEELMDIEVTSVSKQVEKLDQAASAIQVITQDEIRRMGAVTLPEALRLASNLQVAQLDSRQWAINARGSNTSVSNKLLVLIDGRTVYTPLYAGVFWDAQHVVMEDIDRIEIISGPGGTLWGSNAVNGIINIVTKSTENTQGIYAEAGAGTFHRGFGEARFGGHAGKTFFFRVHGKRLDNAASELESGADGKNPWNLSQGGFRMDWLPSPADRFTVQGDLYGASMQQAQPGSTAANGQYALGRWSRVFSPGADAQIQVYADRSYRRISNTFAEDLRTLDADFQSRISLGERNNVVWGSGYRWMRDEVENSAALAFLPAEKDLHLFSAFVQDQVTVVENLLKITLGTKLEHNDYSELNIMPSGRVALTPTEDHLIWGAVSQAVRSPSRIDVDFFTPAPPLPAGTPRLEGGPDFTSEKLIAYELGYRTRPAEWFSLSVAAFHHRYDDLRLVETKDSSHPEAFVLGNGMEGTVKGVEISGTVRASRQWRLHGGHTFLHEHFSTKEGPSPFAKGSQGNDPAHQFFLLSMLDLPQGLQLNGSARYISRLPFPEVPSYFTYDLSASWIHGNVQFMVTGRDLAVMRHPEFGNQAGRQEISRSVAGKVVLRL